MQRQEIMQEINRIEDDFCGNCEVKKAIRKEHGPTKEIRYCQTVCKYGRTLVKLGAAFALAGLPKTYDGPLLYPTLENYEKLDRLGIPDAEKLKYMRINAYRTLQKYKREWGISEKKKICDLTKQEYEGLSKILDDTTITIFKSMSGATLRKKKRQWGLME